MNLLVSILLYFLCVNCVTVFWSLCVGHCLLVTVCWSPCAGHCVTVCTGRVPGVLRQSRSSWTAGTPCAAL